MTEPAKVFDRIVNARRSVRKYDTEAPYDPDIVTRSLARAALAPNSSNMQLWEFYRVRNPEVKKELAEACLNQSAARTASELVVVVVRQDLWKKRRNFNLEKIKSLVGPQPNEKEQRAVDYYQKLIPFAYGNDRLGIWGLIKNIATFFVGFFRAIPRQHSNTAAQVVAHKSAALAAMTFMYSIQAEGLNTCPMEGFDSWKVKKALALPFSAQINMVISLGVGTSDGIYGPRWRVPNQEVIKEI